MKILCACVSVTKVLNRVHFFYADVLPVLVSYLWLETQSAVCARNSFHPDANWGSTWWPTQERNPFTVRSVANDLLTVSIWRGIPEFIQERDHFSVQYVRSSSQTIVFWRHTLVFIQWINHTSALCATKCSHLNGIWESITAFTLVKNPIIAWFVENSFPAMITYRSIL
jgi:hypothetical protein